MRQLRERGEVKQSEKCPNFVLEQVQQLNSREDYRRVMCLFCLQVNTNVQSSISLRLVFFFVVVVVVVVVCFLCFSVQ